MDPADAIVGCLAAVNAWALYRTLRGVEAQARSTEGALTRIANGVEQVQAAIAAQGRRIDGIEMSLGSANSERADLRRQVQDLRDMVVDVQRTAADARRDVDFVITDILDGMDATYASAVQKRMRQLGVEDLIGRHTPGATVEG